MKKCFVTLSILLILIVVLASSSIAAPTYLSMGTSSIGGTGQIIGSAIAAAVNQASKDIKIAAEATGGWGDNLRLLQNGYIDLAMCSPGDAYNAYTGKDQELYKDLRAVMGGHIIYSHLYTLAKNEINSISDLKNKKISVGAVGSFGNAGTQLIMDVYGMEMGKDWTPEYLGHADGSRALRDGQVDAVFICSTIPTPPCYRNSIYP